METRPYELHDLFWLDTHTPPGWFAAAGLRRLADPRLSVSYTHHDTYLGSSGMFPLWEGVYEAWLVLLVQPPSGLELITHVRRALHTGATLTHAHRLQSYCLADYPAGLLLARRLGFQIEGTLRQATPTKTDLLVLGKVT